MRRCERERERRKRKSGKEIKKQSHLDVDSLGLHVAPHGPDVDERGLF